MTDLAVIKHGVALRDDELPSSRVMVIVIALILTIILLCFSGLFDLIDALEQKE